MAISPFRPRAKLTDLQRAEIRRIFKTRKRTEAEFRLIGALYKVSASTISRTVYFGG